MDYKKDLQIDENSLDKEWKHQPFLYMQYAEELAKANSSAQHQKEKMDVIKAELDTKYRRLIDSEGEKVTEARVNARIMTDETYQKAQEECHKADYEASILSAAVKAFEHKKKALEKLVDLYLGGYYSAPRNKEMEEVVTEKAAESQRKRLNRGRKDE